MVPPPEAIDPAALPPLPQGPPVVRADGRAAPPGIPGNSETFGKVPAGPTQSPELESPDASVAWALAREQAAGLVPADVSGALLVASVGELLDDLRALMQALDDAGVHSRFDLRYADGLRKALDTVKLEGRALSGSGLVAPSPAALWWRPEAWIALLPIGPEGLPSGLIERGMRIRAGWPGAGCTLGRVRVGALRLATCRSRGRVALFVGVRADRLLLGGADDLAALRRAVRPPRATLAAASLREALPDPPGPLELWARGLSALWSGVLRLGLRVQAGGVFVRGAASSQSLILSDAPAPYVALESVPAALRLRAALGTAGRLATSLGVLAALEGICPRCKAPADRAAARALDESVGSDVALLLRGFDPALFSAGLRGASRGQPLSPAVRALAGVEQLWLLRVHDPAAASAALDAWLLRVKKRGLQIDPPDLGARGGTEAPALSVKVREGEWFHRIVRTRGAGTSPGAPLEIALGLFGDTLLLASTRELAKIGRRIAREESKTRGGRAFTLSLDPGELARAIDLERLPDPPTTLAEALLIHGLELARAPKRTPPWRVELWPDAGRLAFTFTLPTPQAARALPR